MTLRPPLPPFDHDSATEKVRAAEDAWNSRDPERCAGADTPDSWWRDRSRYEWHCDADHPGLSELGL